MGVNVPKKTLLSYEKTLLKVLLTSSSLFIEPRVYHEYRRQTYQHTSSTRLELLALLEPELSAVVLESESEERSPRTSNKLEKRWSLMSRFPYITNPKRFSFSASFPSSPRSIILT